MSWLFKNILTQYPSYLNPANDICVCELLNILSVDLDYPVVDLEASGGGGGVGIDQADELARLVALCMQVEPIALGKEN